MTRIVFIALLALSLLPLRAFGAVEIARSGHLPRTIKEVYLRDGVPYLAIEEVLAAVGLKGKWDSVRHVFTFDSPAGKASLSPGRSILLVNGASLEFEPAPRFLDGHLRVPGTFVTGPLTEIMGEPVFFRDLDPSRAPPPVEESPLDRLFAFLLRREAPEPEDPPLRGIAIDPAHGGQDPGALSAEGDQEKTVVLEVSRSLEKLIKMRIGIPVHLSRDGDYTLTPEKRLEAATRPGVDAFLLLHAQAALAPAPRGVTLFVRPQDEGGEGEVLEGEGESMRLARHLAASFRRSGIPVVGVIRAPLPGLGRGDLPAVLVELGFLSNPDDRTLLTTSAGRQDLAEALYAGLKNFADERKETTP